MRRATGVGRRILGVAVACVAVANLLHRVVFPQVPPDPATYPRVGDSFASTTEGFTQQVVGVQEGWLLLRTRIAPRAPGPPLHVHRSFAETFSVSSGTLHLELPGGVIRLAAGETYRIEPGTPHRPYNPTDEEISIASDTPAMPASFGACLVQIYHFLDAAQGQMGPGLMMRIASLDPICDASAPQVPAVARAGMAWLVLPFARVLGYENYYPELSLHPHGLTRG